MDMWDDAKRALNIEKHGVDFADLGRFGWEDALLFEDLRRDYGETRMIAMGLIGPRLHVVVYTDRPAGRRIISARKANDREVSVYADHLDTLKP